jgi:hypothetical protein
VTAHHDRVRAVLLVHGLEADRRSDSGEDDEANLVVRLTGRVIRVQARLDEIRPPATTRTIGGPGDHHDTGADADAWLLAVYDASLVELCRAVGLGQSLVDDTVSPDAERQRVELELLSSVLLL